MPRSYLNEHGVKIKGRKVNDEDALASDNMVHLVSTLTNSLQEFTLFDADSDMSQGDGVPNDHELLTCPILTREAYVAIDGKKTIGQYGVLGKIIGIGSVCEARC